MTHAIQAVSIKSLIVVETTVSTQIQATFLTEQVLQQHDAACASIHAISSSLYWWDGKLCNEPEWHIQFKTLDVKKDKLINLIKKIHPYQVPQIISYTAHIEHDDYAKWLHFSLMTLKEQGECL